MHAGVAAAADVAPIEELRALLGSANVLVDASELTFHSTDVYRRADIDAVAVARPATLDELSKAVALCTGHGMAVVPRGGGLSYTGGFLPTRPNSIIFDMQRLDRIVEINPTDMYVTVECGATWKTLYETLVPLGLRTPYFGPMSGYGSTIGGALSQGSIFLGSTQHGSTAETTLGLEVVIADGSIVRTGSAGGMNEPGPFFRNYGPDLTGLFLHDAGALGFKARATLRLIDAPPHSGFASFTFSSHADLLQAMSEVSRRGLASECFGADPYIWGMRLWDDDIVRDVKRAIGVVRGARTLFVGLKNAARMAVAGRQALAGVEYAMNVAVDGRSQAEVELHLRAIRKIASAGSEVEPTVPLAIRGAPFLPPNDILGPGGHRWAPNHGIAPHSRVVAVVDALRIFFDARREEMARHGIEWGYVTFAISTSAILVEPMLYWPGARELYHERVIQPVALAKLPSHPADPEAAAAVGRLRNDLTRFWVEQGCAHFQIGKTYRYLESRQPPVRRLVEQLKRAVDPRGLVNPGSLGLA